MNKEQVVIETSPLPWRQTCLTITTNDSISDSVLMQTKKPATIGGGIPRKRKRDDSDSDSGDSSDDSLKLQRKANVMRHDSPIGCFSRDPVDNICQTSSYNRRQRPDDGHVMPKVVLYDGALTVNLDRSYGITLGEGDTGSITESWRQVLTEDLKSSNRFSDTIQEPSPFDAQLN